MSNRSLLEFNHDYCPRPEKLSEWAEMLMIYLTSGDKEFLPQGVAFKHRRHHSEPCPLDRASLTSATAPDELARAIEARKHTQDWYARHYGKLHDWARKILPEPYRTQFFNCVANGTWDSTKDVGKPYMSVGAGMITPSGYIKFDTAQEQILHDQTTRAEEAEMKLLALTSATEGERDAGNINHRADFATAMLGSLELCGITFCDDLVNEGTPWECAAEPEPQYFETLTDAVRFYGKLAALPERATAGVGAESREPKEATMYSYESIPDGSTRAGVHFRIRDAADNRIATSYLEENAHTIVEALNFWAARAESPSTAAPLNNKTPCKYCKKPLYQHHGFEIYCQAEGTQTFAAQPEER